MGLHYSLIELIEDEEDLAKEQDILDDHDDDITQMYIAVERLLSSCTSISDADPNSKSFVTRKLLRIQKKLESVSDAIDAAPVDEDIDYSLVQQHETDLVDYKRELADIHQELLALDLEESDELNATHQFLYRRLDLQHLSQDTQAFTSK